MENKVEEYSHVLEGRSKEVLHLCQGENWLRLVVSAGGLDLLADTQDEDLDGVPNPSIISLEEVGSVQWPTEDCYICIDLDGESAAIKDMRNITDQDSEGFVVCLQKRLNTLIDHDESGDDSDDDAYGKLEELPRRQLRLIYSGDRVCTLTAKPNTLDEPSQEECTGHLGLVLTYRQCRGSAKYKYSNTQASQFTTTSTLDVPCAGLRDAMSTQDSHGTTTDKTESQQLPRSIDTALHPGASQSEESVVDDVEFDDDGEQTQLIPFATQEEDGLTVEDTLREEPQDKLPIAEKKDPNEVDVQRTELFAKELAPSLNNAPAISHETRQRSGKGLVADAGGKAASSVAECSGEHDDCSRSPYREHQAGGKGNGIPGPHIGRANPPDDSIRECFTDGNRLRKIDTSHIHVPEPCGDHMAPLKEQLGNIPADGTTSCRPRLDADQLSCRSPAREKFDEETVFDAPIGAVSSVCTERFEEPTQSLPFSFTGVAVENSTETPTARERVVRPFSHDENAEKLSSTDLNHTLSVDFQGPADNDNSESTALTEVDDENRQGSSNIHQDVENLNAKDEEEVLDDPEHVALGPFSPRSQGTRARSVVESANPSRTDIAEDDFRSGGNPKDTNTLSDPAPKGSNTKVGDSKSGRQSPMLNIANSIRKSFTVSGTVLECHSHSASGAMEGTDKGSRIVPECSAAASHQETHTRSRSSRKRAVRDLPPNCERKPGARSFRRSQGLETAGDEKPLSNSIGSRKRQRRESQNINVLVTGVPITARHRSVSFLSIWCSNSFNQLHKRSHFFNRK
jgi:hypothetical protein